MWIFFCEYAPFLGRIRFAFSPPLVALWVYAVSIRDTVVRFFAVSPVCWLFSFFLHCLMINPCSWSALSFFLSLSMVSGVLVVIVDLFHTTETRFRIFGGWFFRETAVWCSVYKVRSGFFTYFLVDMYLYLSLEMTTFILLHRTEWVLTFERGGFSVIHVEFSLLYL